jgi:miniconductance mechanosensitive channel
MIQTQISTWLASFYDGVLPTSGNSMYLLTTLLFLSTLFLSLILWWITRSILLSIIHSFASKTKTHWDDLLITNKFFSAIANVIPLSFMHIFLAITFYALPEFEIFFLKLVDLILLLVILVSIKRLLSTARDVILEKERFKDKPIHSYFQVVKIIITGIFIILMLSLATDKSPVYFLTSLGAMTAILLLVFKDTILGFVGSIQLSANDMIRIGDWVTMEKYGADGDVIEISLATVKVQNFDKTITTIPTYSFISDSFKNWRGMEDSDGRRIKRAIQIKMERIRFATPEMITELKKINILCQFIEERESQIQEYNKENQFEQQDSPLNGRKQTNVGLYRRYIEYYLRNNPHINQDMTLMVRQLAPNSEGLPIEIYCFTKTKKWVEYEMVMGDIFDHLLSAVRYFDLEVFEKPTGSDIKSIVR